MIFNKEEINKLIADIDNLLVSGSNPLSKLLSSQGEDEKNVLGRVRAVLVSINEGETPSAISETTNSDQPQTRPLSSLITRYVEKEQNKTVTNDSLQLQEQVNLVSEQLKEQMSVIIQPLQAEVSGLLEERASLVQEIRELEQKRLQNYSLTQQLANQEQIINEFIQVLTNRLAPNLIPYLTQTLSSSSVSPSENNPAVNTSNIEGFLGANQGLEKLDVLARDLDQRLLSLDGTVNVVFQALERNINTYYQSLSQALTRMHSQGMQGEQLMTNFLNSLHQSLQEKYPDTLPLISGLNVITENPTFANSNYGQFSQQDTKIQTTDQGDDLDSVLSQLNIEESVENRTTELENYLELQPEVTATEIVDDLDSVLSQLNIEESLENRTTELENYLELQPEVTATEIVNDLDSVLSQLSTQEPLTIPEIDLQSFPVDEFVSSSATDNEDENEPEIIENLDILLSQLTATRASEPATANFNNPALSELDNIDEVDELYASLFGVQEEKIANDENNLLIANEVPNVVSSENVSLSSEIGIVEDSFLTTSEVSITENSTELVETPGTVELWEEPLLPENSQSLAEFASTPRLVDSLPDSSDTITVLTDLLVDFSNEEEGFKNLPESEIANTNLSLDSVVSANEEQARVETNQKQNVSKPEYIKASSSENLLSLESDAEETEGIPNITLSEEQLEQLDQDLASFDWRLSSQSEQKTNLQISQDLVYESTESEQVTNLQSSEGLVYGNAEIESREFPFSESSSTVADENVLLATVAELYGVETEKKAEEKKTSQESAAVLNEQGSEHNANVYGNLERPDANSVWYLGIDLGTTGISAALLDRSRLVVYPIYWSTDNKSGETSLEQSFRLPAEVYLPTASVPQSVGDNQEITRPAGVGQENNRSTSVSQQNLYSTHLKPFLQVAIPYQTNQQKWEPILQLNEFSAGPLIWVLRSLSKLLLTLRSDQVSTTPALIAHSADIDDQTFLAIINNLSGVVCTCPSSYSEQYRFNVREAILTSQLVTHAQQIFFIEEAIASLLPELEFGNSQIVQLNSEQGLQPLKALKNSPIGSTLTLNVGAAATEMALVDIPAHLHELQHKDFMLHSFAYGGKAIEQDIICQLLLPPKSRQPRGTENGTQNTVGIPSWQPSIPGLNQAKWSSLNLEGLELPRVGEPDVIARIKLQQKLESSLLGQGLLDAALALKLILQHQESFTLELADQRWVLQRRDLETQIFVPYVRRLNREVNKLLVAGGVPTEAINQAILSGGVASVNTVNRWLRQKLPNAQIIQDLYLGKNGAPNCSRVAYGVTILPLYPQVLETARQQYTDYFLFNELLTVLADNLRGEATRSLSFGEVLQLFESRGINTRICQQRLLAFLEGELPAGLVPIIISDGATATESEQVSFNSIWLTQKSQENPDYQAIASSPLFEKQGNLSYRPNLQQLLLLRRYLDAIKASTRQSLEEPLTVNFATTINS